MDTRGGCCIANYGGGGGYNMSTVNRIMMKFRPIAPKPGNKETSSSNSPEMSETSPNNKSARGRRRLTTTITTTNNNNNNNSNRKRKEKSDVAAVVTLPLIPESPDRINSPGRRRKKLPTWISFEGAVCKQQMEKRVIGSWVTVECITETWTDVNGGRINLEGDRCPGFISDGYGRVTWTNEEYKKMVMQGEEEGRGQVVVWLAMKDKVAVTGALANNDAFTCRVRLQNGKHKSSITLPCDVWKLDAASFAWRLDVAAALSLGR